MPLSTTHSITIENVSNIVNVTELPELLININHFVFGGLLFYILLWALFFIIVITLEQLEKQILNNVMYSATAITIVAFFMRAIQYDYQGSVTLYLLTDYQLWSFALIAILTATLVWATKEKGS